MPLRVYQCTKCRSEVDVLETMKALVIDERLIIADDDATPFILVDNKLVCRQCQSKEEDGSIRRIPSKNAKDPSWGKWKPVV